MEKISLNTSDTPNVTLDIKGNLTVKGWMNSEVIASCPTQDNLQVEEDGDQISIRCDSDCTIKVPYGASLNDVQVSGNGSIKSVEGAIYIENVYGNLTLRSVGSLKIGVIHGNLIAKNISGRLILQAVKGNVNVKDLQGDFKVEDAITGNLKLSDVDNDASASANGNATIHLDPSPGHTYTFKAKGNIACYIPTDASTNIEIAKASKIFIKLPDTDLPSQPNAPYDFLLGEGDAILNISAGGNVYLSGQFDDFDISGVELDFNEDFEDFSLAIEEQILQQMEAQMDMLEAELDLQMANISRNIEISGIPPEKAEKIAEKTRRASERANIKAQEKMKRAQEKMQRKLEAARRRAERKARAAERAARDRRRRPETYTWSPPKHEPVREPVTDEERLLILKMLEQGTISIDEAEQLLEALEGKND
jgi:hypothetical protein